MVRCTERRLVGLLYLQENAVHRNQLSLSTTGLVVNEK